MLLCQFGDVSVGELVRQIGERLEAAAIAVRDDADQRAVTPIFIPDVR
jgi:hypothetical protein